MTFFRMGIIVSFVLCIALNFMCVRRTKADTYRQSGNFKYKFKYIQEATWNEATKKYIRNKDKIWIIDSGNIYR